MDLFLKTLCCNAAITEHLVCIYGKKEGRNKMKVYPLHSVVCWLPLPFFPPPMSISGLSEQWSYMGTGWLYVDALMR